MANKTYKIGVVGNRDAILPFRLIGFQTFPVKEAQEAINILRQLSRDKFGVIYLTEDMAREIPETLAYYDQQVTPAVILIPTHQGSSGLGRARLQENVEKAVGQNIL
ncbi:V-type ATP synthase subunit F [Streptococcus massiliensis]|uniref:V-type ATP synthase subunit F n=1 Tax=Streptococcus massiliensis TaxID=313439 RepID=A0A380KY47_9STRE|nr:V-type ATP synthase subunit F [Streptococcus massiliensis]SUN76057.1 V-type ATP synthase subunit F [Streptococcus massiliensis]